MPISREEFESGQIDLSIYLEGILTADILAAWNLEELVVELKRILRIDVGQDTVMPGLRALEIGGKIDRKEIWGRDYWIWKME